MDQRAEPFIRKFKSAQRYLQTKDIQDLVSLKFRDDCVDCGQYSHFIDQYIRRTLAFAVEPAQGDFWGRAWVVTDSRQNKVILVEHETGLEILAVAGSVASLIALVPLISSGWNKLRDRFSRHYIGRGPVDFVEVRRFNETNILIDQQTPSVEVYVFGAAVNEYPLMKQRVEALEIEVASLKQKLADRPGKRTPSPKAESKGKRQSGSKATRTGSSERIAE
jgi:hypothetical protein